MATPLEFSHHLDGNVDVISVTGEADNSNTETLFAKMYHKLAPLSKKRVLLDLRNLTYCNSTFLGYVAAFHVDLTNVSGGLAVVANAKIVDPFMITGLDAIMTIGLDFDKTLSVLKKMIITPSI
jgi:anti-anti-sigma factor